MERQKVLITGGAGFLGINLIRYLRERGYAPVSLDIEEFDYPEKNEVETIKGDIRDKALVDRAMVGVDFVVHTAAALPLYSPEDIYTTEQPEVRSGTSQRGIPKYDYLYTKHLQANTESQRLTASARHTREGLPKAPL